MSWEERAWRLAGEVTHPASRWRAAVASVPRHVLVPAWWQGDGGWARHDAATEPEAPYRNRTLVTQVGDRHADHARPGDRAEGMPTSSSTKPSLVLAMYRAAMICDGMDVLDVGTGSGYGAGLLTARLGREHVTTIDVDPYAAAVAVDRLKAAGLRPDVAIGDATGPLAGEYDRIVSMMSVSPVPASWMAALRPGGRLVTAIAGTWLVVTADRQPDGSAAGQVEFQRASFMASRSGTGYPPPLMEAHPEARDGDGDTSRKGAYPVTDVRDSYELHSMLGVTIPGIECHHEKGRGGARTAWLLHPDGSWARAEGGDGYETFVVQAGPRRLWDELDALRGQWLRNGSLPVFGSAVTIGPDGSITFSRGKWSATIPARSPAGVAR